MGKGRASREEGACRRREVVWEKVERESRKVGERERSRVGRRETGIAGWHREQEKEGRQAEKKCM